VPGRVSGVALGSAGEESAVAGSPGTVEPMMTNTDIRTSGRTRLTLRRVTLLMAFALTATTLAVTTTAPQPADAAGHTEGFNPIVPRRVMDTRSGFGGPVFGPGMARQLSLADAVPAGATGVVLNLTATVPTANTFITVWPAGKPRPESSNLNVQAGQTRANGVIVGVGADRTISLYTHSGTTHVIVDVMGYFVGEFTGIHPARVMDTRTGFGATRLGAGTTRNIKVAGTAGVPADAAAVALNVTAVHATRATFVTVHPAGRRRPGTSNLNVTPGAAIPNLVVTAVGDLGQVSLYNHSGTVDAIVDIMGYFTPGGTYTPAAEPVRMLDTRNGTCGVRLSAGETRRVRLSTTSPASVALNVTAVNPTHNTFLTVFPAGASRPNTSNLNVPAGSGATPNFVLAGTGAANEISIYNHAGTVDVIVDQFGATAGPVKSGAPTTCVPAKAPLPTEPPLTIEGAVYEYSQIDPGIVTFYYRNASTTKPCATVKTAVINAGWTIDTAPCDIMTIVTATKGGLVMEARWDDISRLISLTVYN
jgi:hypothetical protein